MKKIVIALAVLFSANFVNAQDDECAKKYSMYKEFVNIESYSNALPMYREVFNNCKKFSKSIYNDGIKIYKGMMAKTSDQNTINAYLDTLKIIYMQRIENYGEESYVLGRYAADILKYKKSPEVYSEAYQVLKKSVETSDGNPDLTVVSQFLQVSTLLYSKNKIDANQLFDDVMPLYTTVLLKSKTADEKYATSVEKISTNLKKNFSGLKNYQETFYNQLNAKSVPQENQEAEIWVNAIKDVDCEACDYYVKISEKLYSDNPTATAAAAIARYYRKTRQWEKAAEFYAQAIEKETDNINKADYYYEYATVENFRKKFQSAVSKAKKAVELNPKFGAAYMVIAAIYGGNANSFGDDDFSHRKVYWVAADYLLRAKNADPTLTSDANSLLAKYSAHFPNKEDAFMHSVKPGDVVTVNCYDTETTTARF